MPVKLLSNVERIWGDKKCDCHRFCRCRRSLICKCRNCWVRCASFILPCLHKCTAAWRSLSFLRGAVDFTSCTNENLSFLHPTQKMKLYVIFRKRPDGIDVQKATVQHCDVLPLPLRRIVVDVLDSTTALLLDLDFIIWMCQLPLITSHLFPH